MADRYWVGGSANWDATAGIKWAATSGGAGGETVPTAADDVYFDAASGATTVTVSATASCRNLTFTGFTGTFAGTAALSIAGSAVLAATMTRTYTGAITFTATTAQTITSGGVALDSALTFNGVAGSWALQDALVAGSTRTITLTNGTLNLNNFTATAGFFNALNTNIKTIAYGTGKFILAGSGAYVWRVNATGLSQTGTPRADLTYAGSVGTRQISPGVAAILGGNQPVNFYITAGTDTVQFPNNNERFGTLDFIGFKGVFATPVSGDEYPLGDLILDPGMTMTGNCTWRYEGAGTYAVNTNGATFSGVIRVNAAGASVVFTGNSVISSGIVNSTGNLSANNVNVTTPSLVSNNANVRTISLGSGTWTLTGSGTAFDIGSVNLTLVPSTGTINMTSASAKTFSGGGSSWPTLNQGGAGTLTIQQSNTFANITNTVQPCTISLVAGTTQTVSAFSVAGTAGNLVTLNSSTPGSRATLSDSDGLNSVSFTSIKDIFATGGALWDAPTTSGNVDAGNNIGWDFGLPFVYDIEFSPSLRSFTERRHF